MATAAAAARITPPPDFPVFWARPEDPESHWTRDREHSPHPITPMYDSVCARLVTLARRRTLPVYDEAIVERQDRLINGYDYVHLVPFAGTPEEMQARAQSNREKVGAVSLQLGHLWENCWKPEIEGYFTFWENFDLRRASLPDLRAHLEASLERAGRLWELHYLFGPPMWFALAEFEECYCDLFPGSTTLDAHRLLQGFDNKTLEMGRAIWRLSRLARAESTVRQAFAELPATEVVSALQNTEAGRAFLREFDLFLAAFGGRSDLWDWGYPSWQDDPTPVINSIKNTLGQPDRDLRAELRLAAEEREAAIAEALRQLEGYPGAVIERFQQLLTAAQAALTLTANHTFYLDFNGFGHLHRIIRELGVRFTDGSRLHSPDDAFYLSQGWPVDLECAFQHGRLYLLQCRPITMLVN